MKVINKMNPYETFGKLCGGDTFILAEEADNCAVDAYIKIPSVDDGAFNAVCLNDGSLEYFDPEMSVIVPKVTLTLE